jgi:hypothetical protein
MMFEMRDEYLVAGSEIRPTETLRDQVNGLCSAARENYLPGTGRIDEAAERF